MKQIKPWKKTLFAFLVIFPKKFTSYPWLHALIQFSSMASKHIKCGLLSVGPNLILI